MRSSLIIVALLCPAAVSAGEIKSVAEFKGWQGPKPAKTPCKCRSRDGNKLDLGAKVCVQRGDQMVTMQCRLVLNNTAWQQIENGCDVAMN